MTAMSKIQSAAPALWFGNTLVTVNISATDGSNRISVLEHHLPSGDSPPLHVHRNEDEIFHILAGVMRFNVDGKELEARAGQTVMAPKGLPHSFRVQSAEGAHMLTITQGGDFENMVRAAGRPAQGNELPPAAAPTPEMIEFLVRTCAENNIDIVGAPLS